MDARVIQAKHHRPNQGATGESTQATEAAYKVKQSSNGQQKTTDGYKAHRNVEEDGLISNGISLENRSQLLLTDNELAIIFRIKKYRCTRTYAATN